MQQVQLSIIINSWITRNLIYPELKCNNVHSRLCLHIALLHAYYHGILNFYILEINWLDNLWKTLIPWDLKAQCAMLKKKYGLIFLFYIHVHKKGELRNGSGFKIVLNIFNA